MFSLLIVDDEKITRDSLKAYIPWNELGIGTVETAKSGQTALELIPRIIPDIVLTDVRMPKMDGIELATRLKDLLPECKIIFLSGYSDKEYLKSAIHLKAINYIEKPVDLDEITRVLKDTVALCQEETEKKAEIKKLKSNLEESMPLISQEIASVLVKENADISRLMSKYDHPLINAPQDGYYTAACIQLNWNISSDFEKKELIKSNIMKMLLGDHTVNDPYFTAAFDENDRIIIINTGDINNSVISDRFYEIIGRYKNQDDNLFSLSIGMGKPVKGLKKIHTSYKEAIKAVNRQFYHGVNRVFQPVIDNNIKIEVEQNLFVHFKECLKKDNKTEVMNIIDNLTQKARAASSSNTDYVKNLYFNLLQCIFEVTRERGLIETAVENERSYIWQEIIEIKTLSELAKYIRANAETVFERMVTKDSVNRKTHEIMNYINSNFSNKNLSTQMIARNSYLSQTYLCSFFKKSTGKTLNEYITEVRMEKAKEMLKDIRLKQYDIAYGTGFRDTNYFSTLFKKYTGYTPTEFREKYYI